MDLGLWFDIFQIFLKDSVIVCIYTFIYIDEKVGKPDARVEVDSKGTSVKVFCPFIYLLIKCSCTIWH